MANYVDLPKDSSIVKLLQQQSAQAQQAQPQTPLDEPNWFQKALNYGGSDDKLRTSDSGLDNFSYYTSSLVSLPGAAVRGTLELGGGILGTILTPIFNLVGSLFNAVLSPFGNIFNSLAPQAPAQQPSSKEDQTTTSTTSSDSSSTSGANSLSAQTANNLKLNTGGFEFAHAATRAAVEEVAEADAEIKTANANHAAAKKEVQAIPKSDVQMDYAKAAAEVRAYTLHLDYLTGKANALAADIAGQDAIIKEYKTAPPDDKFAQSRKKQAEEAKKFLEDQLKTINDQIPAAEVARASAEKTRNSEYQKIEQTGETKKTSDYIEAQAKFRAAQMQHKIATTLKTSAQNKANQDRANMFAQTDIRRHIEQQQLENKVLDDREAKAYEETSKGKYEDIREKHSIPYGTIKDEVSKVTNNDYSSIPQPAGMDKTTFDKLLELAKAECGKNTQNGAQASNADSNGTPASNVTPASNGTPASNVTPASNGTLASNVTPAPKTPAPNAPKYPTSLSDYASFKKADGTAYKSEIEFKEALIKAGYVVEADGKIDDNASLRIRQIIDAIISQYGAERRGATRVYDPLTVKISPKVIEDLSDEEFKELSPGKMEDILKYQDDETKLAYVKKLSKTNANSKSSLDKYVVYNTKTKQWRIVANEYSGKAKLEDGEVELSQASGYSEAALLVLLNNNFSALK